MNTIEDIILKMKAVIDNPSKTVADYTAQTGKKAVGVFPIYTPEEIVHAAGLLPIGIWGGQVELNLVRSVLPAFACSIMQSVKEFELLGVYDDLAAVIVPSPCDTLKAMGQKWSREVPCIQFVHPFHRQLPAAREFLAAEYFTVKTRLEEAIGDTISNEAIQESIKVYNEHRGIMRKFSDSAATYPDLIDPIQRHIVMKSAFFMRKEKHTELVRELIDMLTRQQPKPWNGMKIILSGIMLEPDSAIQIFKDLNLAIVADDLAQESRQYRIDVAEDGDQFMALAGWWQDMYGCCTTYDPQKPRVEMLLDMVEKYDADACILCMMKFCDPEEFDYPIIKKAFEGKNVPLLQIEIDQQVQFSEQIRTRIQSFVEMLNQ